MKVISILIENEPGALSRVCGLFSARAYNIHSLSVAPTHDPSTSRMTIVTLSNEKKLEQIIKQINKLVEVAKVIVLNEGGAVSRQLTLVKLYLNNDKLRQDISQRILLFSAKIVDVTNHTYMIELIGDDNHIDGFLQSIPQSAIVEVAKTGLTGLLKGK